MSGTYFSSGKWNIICDVCGFKFKSDEVRRRWDGLIVCKDDFEHDHPQKFIRVKADGLPVNPIRNRPAEVFVVRQCTPFTVQALADIGTADCMLADYYNPSVFVCDAINTRAVADVGTAGCMTVGRF